MSKILTFSLTMLILVVLVRPGLAYRDGGRDYSNIVPGTRFGRERLAQKPYPYLYPVNPELGRQEQRERRENAAPPGEASPEESTENEKPREKKPIKPKFIEIK